MKIMTSFLFTLILLAAGTLQAVLLPADQLLAQAQKDKASLLQALDSLKNERNSIATDADFYTYLRILTPLQELAETQKLPADSVVEVGYQLTASSVKWISLLTTPGQDLLDFHQWSTAETARLVLPKMESEIQNEAVEKVAAKVRMVLLGLQTWANSKFPNNSALLESYRELGSGLALRYLRKDSLKQEEKAAWLQVLQTETTSIEYAEVLRGRLATVNASNLLVLTITTYELRIWLEGFSSSSRPRLSLGTMNRLRGLLAHAVELSFETGNVLFNDKIARILKLLANDHLASMAKKLVTDPGPKTPEAQKYLADFSAVLIEALRGRSMTEEANQLQQHFGAVKPVDPTNPVNPIIPVNPVNPIVPVKPINPVKPVDPGNPPVSGFDKLEGTYELSDRTGDRWFITVVRSGAHGYRVALGCDDRDHYYYADYMVHDSNRGVYWIYDSKKDATAAQHPVFAFAVSPSGGINFRHYLSSGTYDVYNGQKSDNYPDYFSASFNPQSEMIDGTYAGEMTFADGTTTLVRLRVSNRQLLDSTARLSLFNQEIKFAFGNDGRAGFLYLNSGSLPSGSFVQIRAYQRGRYLEGYYILGGWGIAPVQFRLSKE